MRNWQIKRRLYISASFFRACGNSRNIIIVLPEKYHKNKAIYDRRADK
jgi:hypothetical protein